jgi:hypothetical protein
MGLFDDVFGKLGKPGSSPIEAESQIADFEHFLKWLESIKEKPSGQELYDLITDPFITAVSGSSLLAYRQGKSPFGKDIDIFIDCSLEDYRDKISNLFRSLYSNSRQLSKVTRNSSYPYIKKKHILNIDYYKVENLILNFVFIEPQQPVDGQITPTQLLVNQITHSSSLAYFLGEISSELSQKSGSLMGVGFIENTFDFEELKYIWSFRKNEAVTCHAFKLPILEILLIEVSDIKNNSDKTRALNQLTVTKNFVEKQDKEFREKFRRNDELHVSQDFATGYGFYYSNRRSLEVEGLSPVSGEPLLYNLESIRKRINKYTDYGYKIKDDRGVLTGLLFGATLDFLNIIDDQNFQSVLRSSTLGQKNLNTVRQYKFVSGIRKLAVPFLEQETKKEQDRYTTDTNFAEVLNF